MSDFLKNILSRHLHPADLVKPRLRGRFEPVNSGPDFELQNDSSESNIASKESYTDRKVQSIDEPVKSYSIDFNPEANSSAVFPNDQEQGKTVHSDHTTETDNGKIIPLPFDQQLTATDENLKTSLSSNIESFVLNPNEHPPLPTSDITNVDTDGSLNLIEPHDVTFKVLAEKKHKEDSKDRINQKEIRKSKSFEKPTGSEKQGFNLPSITAPFKGFKHSFDPDQQGSPQTVVKVSIGRIDVRAKEPKPAPPIKKRNTTKPQMTLSDYLKKQNNRS